VLEAVPNVSEGRDASAVAAIGRAFAGDAALLDVHVDADHHRSVFTIVGEPGALVDSLLGGAVVTLDSVDLRTHEGVHPRVGAIDVVPLVPLGSTDMAEAKRAALSVGERLGDELGVTVLLYGEVGGGRRPAFFRSGGLPELTRRLGAGELAADFGPSLPDPRSGVALVGARAPLVAYNLDLANADLAVAREIAAAVRESSGGMASVQAIGLFLPLARRVQVSMNVLDLERSPLHEVVARVEGEAARRGARVAGGELVGLVPERVLELAEAAGVAIPGVDESCVLERRLAAAL
jgi:glutamate formiminotransferase